MAFKKLTEKRATSRTPQVLTLIVDDSGSMKANNKATQATEAMVNLVTTMQSSNLGASQTRFYLNIAKFGTEVTPMAESAHPKDIPLTTLTFNGDSGETEIAKALDWAAQATEKTISYCRTSVTDYNESETPRPLVVFFTDGGNTGRVISQSTQTLKSISFSGGHVDIVAVGIGLEPKNVPVLEQIASEPDLSVNIDPSKLATFIVDVGVNLFHESWLRC